MFESVLRANSPITEGFYIRELGLFDEDGDLIVITDVPVQYRPATEEGNIVTELLFNISIQVQNADVIEIKLNEQVFATVDMMNRLIERVQTLEQNKQDLLDSSVGIDKWFNTDNRYKDQNIVTIGVKTWALMDESNVLNIADYPILFNNIGAVDRGDGTFAVTNFFDGTTRHLPKGSTRELGSFQDDAMQRIVGSTGTGSGQAIATDIDFASSGKGAIKTLAGSVVGIGGTNEIRWGIIEFDSSLSLGAKTDNNETRMKNTAGQWYVLAKINI